MADPVIDGIAQHRSHHEQPQQQPDIKRAKRSKGPRRKEQRIPREEGCHDKTCFNEDHHKQQRVGPYPVLGNDLAEIFVKVQKKINEEADGFHFSPK